MKSYQKPTFEITAFAVNEAMAAGAPVVNNQGSDMEGNVPVTIYEIVSFGATSNNA